VLPDRQGKGIGRRLMDAVLAHADDRRGMFSSTVHAGATRRYRLGTLRLVGSRARDRQGYAYIDDRGRAVLLAAAHPETAQNLLWEALASSRGDTLVNCITTANQWAVDVGLAARLDIGQEGYLAVRGMTDPAPYLASGHFL
jgi:GNAT superfamily N-acetyltransferase